MRLKSVLAAQALVIGVLGLPACGATVQTTTSFETSGACPREQAVVQRALARSHLRVDVNGDGRLDKVAVASVPEADKPCRAFVGVRLHGGGTYSTHLIPNAAPIKGLNAEIVGLPHLRHQPGAQIVVDTRAAVDSVLAQMFTLADGRLRAVHVPEFADGTFIVAGGGVIYPHGAGCTADGRMVLSKAALTSDGKAYRVVRRTYDVRGKRIRFAAPVVTRATVPANRLVVRFPEFAGSHWKACTGTVRGWRSGRVATEGTST